MQIKAETPEDYIRQLPEERQRVIQQLRSSILGNLPDGFTEITQYGMIGYVIPHSIYPAGYHCDTSQPLPFMGIASQKNFVALYHMGIYADKKLMDWFVGEFPKHSKAKLDMGKSCIRFKKLDQIPYALIGELSTKISSREWVSFYEENLKR